MKASPIITKGATFSPCRRYRYALWRILQDDPTKTYTANYAMFIGLNPSTADEVEDDPTIRRCKAFAKAWGYDTLCMTNLFAFRATLPQDMKAAADPVGDKNDETLIDLARHAGIVVAAWGVDGAYRGRGEFVRKMLAGNKLHYLTLTKAGHPGHPLYLKKSLTPKSWDTNHGENR